MSFLVKKSWVTAADAGLACLSIESARPELESSRVQFHESLFPSKPTPQYPLRHTVVLSCLDIDDLQAIADAIHRYIETAR